MPQTDSKLKDLQVVALAETTVTAYCHAAQASRFNEFWWYFNGVAPFRGYSLPFADRDGQWWYKVKPFFAWPVDFFQCDTAHQIHLPKRSLLGAQWPTPMPHTPNSYVTMNIISSLAEYGLGSIDPNKRRAIRKGLRNLRIERITDLAEDTAPQACEVWNSHVARTGWNSQMEIEHFADTWQELCQWPGTTILGAREKTPPHRLCAWLIVRIIDRTVYIDTIASHSERLQSRPNDTILFVTLMSAATQGVLRAHYSLQSNIETLERFKRSLGFEAVTFSCTLKLRFPVGSLLKVFKPEIHKRLLGGTGPDGQDQTPENRA